MEENPRLTHNLLWGACLGGGKGGFQVGDHPNSGELKIKGMNLLGPNQRKRSSNAKPILRGVSIRRATKNQEC